MNLSFSFIDFLVVLVIVVSAGYAAWRGFMSETLSIFAWAAAAFCTLYFGPWLVPLARGLIATPWLASVAAYAGVFLVVFIPLSFMSYRFSETVKHSPIGPLDRALGIAFGVVRGLVIVGLAYLAFTYFVPIRQQPGWLTEARLLPLMQSSGEVILSIIPNRDHEDFAAGPPPVRATPDSIGDLIRGASPQPRKSDSLGALIQRQNEQANRVPAAGNAAPSQGQKSYGAQDRRALDSLVQTTGSARP
jgi:membrane protein required for colicin V production